MSNKTSDKNVANIEDIKVIQHIISFYKDLDVIHSNDKCKEIVALENVLAEREQDKKRIKELEEESRKKSIELICYQEELENSISTQVVIDKIKENSNIEKEIEEKIKEEENSGDICREYIRDLKRQKGLVKRDILTLQELLEGEK